MFRKLLRSRGQAQAKAYLQTVGLWPLLKAGNQGEIPPDAFDLANIHRLIRRRRPATVVEFGIGFSTIAIAHALMLNGRGHLWSVDANPLWIANVEAKIPDELQPYVTIRQSDVEATTINGELCHLYKTLPNIVPDFVYLDGPSPYDVQGSVRGLGFTQEHGGYRHVVAADLILMESTLQSGFFLLIDARRVNTHFLRRNLKRRYRFRQNRLFRFSTFELLERTGRHSFKARVDDPMHKPGPAIGPLPGNPNR